MGSISYTDTCIPRIINIIIIKSNKGGPTESMYVYLTFWNTIVLKYSHI